jgi:type IV pilus assembly protein PilA
MTMLEVLVVVAIMAVLALIAIPSLQDRIVRQQIADAYPPLAAIAEPPIALAWATTQILPADNAAAGLPVAAKIVSNYVSSVTVANGAIHIKFGNSANTVLRDKILTLRPAVVDDTPIVPPTWICGNAEWPSQMTVKGENRTDIPAVYLPVNCRGR